VPGVQRYLEKLDCTNPFEIRTIDPRKSDASIDESRGFDAFDKQGNAVPG